MKLKYSVIFLLALVISCGAEQKREGIIEKQDNVEQEIMKSTEVILSESPTKFDVNTIKDIRKSLPKQIKYKGELKSAHTWRDLNGENILVNSVKRAKIDLVKEGERLLSGYLYSSHFVKKGNKYELLVRTTDREEACDFDLHIDFKTSPIIQDADRNGIAEVIIAITKLCTSDMSPRVLKILMHENMKKYALRGMQHIIFTDEFLLPKDFEYNKEKYSGDKSDYTWQDGRYTNENEFEIAPKSFLIEARKAWRKNAEWDMR